MSRFFSKEKTTAALPPEGSRTGWANFEHIMGIIIMTAYHFRKVVMAAPVIFYALKLAAYNSSHLPEKVGLFLQTSGEFAQMVDRGVAVTGPLFLTCGCLVMMLFSRKAMYAWAISIFTLVLPILLLISNQYPC